MSAGRYLRVKRLPSHGIFPPSPTRIRPKKGHYDELGDMCLMIPTDDGNQISGPEMRGAMAETASHRQQLAFPRDVREARVSERIGGGMRRGHGG